MYFRRAAAAFFAPGQPSPAEASDAGSRACIVGLSQQSAREQAQPRTGRGATS
jgi:hypothetical protein